MLSSIDNSRGNSKEKSESPEKLLLDTNDKKLKSSSNSRSSSLNGSINGKYNNTNNYFNYNNNSSSNNNNNCEAPNQINNNPIIVNNNNNNKSTIARNSSEKQMLDIKSTSFDVEEEYDGLFHNDLDHSNNTLQMLNILRKNRQLCDLILQLDDDSQDIYCHQVILACNSKFFMEIFNNYELEEKHNSNNIKEEDETLVDTKQNEQSNETIVDTSSSSSSSSNGSRSSIKKKSLRSLVNKNHNSSHKQLLFCLSDYLRNYLNDTYQHHYAKINSITNHNSQFHHHHFHHVSHNNNHLIDAKMSASHDEDTQSINHSLDSEALKLCIDYMYTSQLRIPSYLLPHVYTLAYHLSFDNIVELCAQYLTKNLSVDNCLGIRSFALDENLIQASTQCIEKNIEYILQLRPFANPHMRSVSSSLSSLQSNCSTSNKLNGNQLGEMPDLPVSSPTLSSSLNLANKEFNHLPRINIELVGLSPQKYKLPDSIVNLTQLCMNWLVQELVDKQGELTFNDLCDNLNMLYINDDHTLHDCCDMDSTNCNFSDYINDYQKLHHLNTLNNNSSTNGGQNNENKNNRRINRHSPSLQNVKSQSPTLNNNNRLKTFKITDQELNAIGTATPIKLKVLHDNEVICTHQASENAFIAICTLTGKLVTLSIHILPLNTKNDDAENELSDSNSNIKIFNIGSGDSDQNLNINNDENKNKIFKKSLSSDPNVESQFSLDQLHNLPQHQLQNNSLNANPTLMRSQSLSSALDAEKLPKMTVPRCSHGVIGHENKLYIIGGYDRGECLDICEIYNPKTNTIQQMESMESRRGRAAVTWFEKIGSIYVMGGSDGHEDLNSIECYNLKNKCWQTLKFDFELDCSNLGHAACNDYIYLVGLKCDGGKSLSRTSCLRYEPISNSFTRLAELNQGRSQSALVWVPLSNNTDNSENSNLNSHLYVFGGHDQIRCLNTCEFYNMQDKKWTLISTMHEPRRGCGAAFHKETQSIYIVGGTNGSNSLKSVEIYNIVTRKWSTGPELNIARTNVAIAFLGNILFAVGGFDGKMFLRSIEYLDSRNLNKGWSLYYKPLDFEFLNDTANHQ